MAVKNNRCKKRAKAVRLTYQQALLPAEGARSGRDGSYLAACAVLGHEPPLECQME